MKPFPLPKDLEEAAAIQKALRENVVLRGDPSQFRYIAALDASHPTRFSRVKGYSVAAVVLWDRREEKVAEVATASVEESKLFPYISGFLSFREIPGYLAALAKLSVQPELLLVDGQGIAHPRGLGIAAHLGVHLDMPAIGVAKTLLYGKPQSDLPPEAGSVVGLVSKAGQIGWVYRSITRVQPLFISPGHQVGMQEALDFVCSLPTLTRLPEPLKQAHIEAAEARRTFSR